MVELSAAGANSTTISFRYRIRNALTFWGFVGPMVIGIIIFTYVPILWGLVLSFFNARYTLTPHEFVGLRNYTAMLQDDAFLESLRTVVAFTVFIVPTTYLAALGLALLLNSIQFGQAFFRSVFFIPTACSYVVASMVWRMSIFNGLPYGLANMLLYEFGVEQPVAWIGRPDPPWYWLVLITARLWLQVGFYMIIFLAALKEIPVSLYEAARVDGAEPGWKTFRYITFPLLRNTSISVILLNLIAAFQAFDEFFNILGGTASSTGGQILARPPLIYLYRVAFTDQNYGRGNAGAFILTALIILTTIILGRLLKLGRSEEGTA